MTHETSLRDVHAQLPRQASCANLEYRNTILFLALDHASDGIPSSKARIPCYPEDLQMEANWTILGVILDLVKN